MDALSGSAASDSARVSARRARAPPSARARTDADPRFAMHPPLQTIMQKIAAVALALLESANAFSAPVMRSRPVQMFSEGDLGVLPPLGVYDPLGLIETRTWPATRSWRSTAARSRGSFLHVILIEAGVRFPTADCAAPAGLFASLRVDADLAWLQIMVTTCMMETGYFLFDYEGYPNVGDREAGDIGGEAWVRYDDPETKTFKLNVERQNAARRCLASPAASSTSSSASTRSTRPAAWTAPRRRPSSKHPAWRWSDASHDKRRRLAFGD